LTKKQIEVVGKKAVETADERISATIMKPEQNAKQIEKTEANIDRVSNRGRINKLHDYFSNGTPNPRQFARDVQAALDEQEEAMNYLREKGENASGIDDKMREFLNELKMTTESHLP